MSIVMDKPGSNGWVHLLSDMPGEEGSKELHAFAAGLGLRKRWVHAPHSYAEHYDIRGDYIQLAEAAGVKLVDRRKLGNLLRVKRHAMGPRRRRGWVKITGSVLQERV